MRYQLTQADRRKGAATTNAKSKAKGWRQQRDAAFASRVSAKRYQLTPEDRRKGGLATAAKRRAKRLEDIYLSGPEKTFAAVATMLVAVHCEHDADIPCSSVGCHAPREEITNVCTDGGREENQRPEPEPVDPFTLSALKRFRLGPLSPLALTRSQRAHVQVMRDAGYLEADTESRVRLTEKGRQAIEAGDPNV